MEELGLCPLTLEKMEKIIEIAEKVTTSYIISKIPLKMISDIDLTVDVEGLLPITLHIDLEIFLSPIMKNINVQKIANKATEKALLAVEKYLRELQCNPKIFFNHK